MNIGDLLSIFWQQDCLCLLKLLAASHITVWSADVFGKQQVVSDIGYTDKSAAVI